MSLYVFLGQFLLLYSVGAGTKVLGYARQVLSTVPQARFRCSYHRDTPSISHFMSEGHSLVDSGDLRISPQRNTGCLHHLGPGPLLILILPVLVFSSTLQPAFLCSLWHLLVHARNFNVIEFIDPLFYC